MSESVTRPRALMASLGTWVPAALLGVYIVVASVSPYLYGDLLAALVLVALGWLAVRQWFPPRVSWAWPLALSSLGLVGFLLGITNGNPGARSTLSIFVLEPVILGTVFALASRERGWRPRLLVMLDVATVLVVLAGVWIYIARHLELPVPAAIYGTRFTAVDMMGVLRTNYQGFNAFVFLAPYAVTRFLRPLDDSTWRRILMLVAGVGGVVLSGRQVLFLLLPAAVVASLGLALLQRLRHPADQPPRRALDIIGAVGALVALGAIVLAGVFLAHSEKEQAAVIAERRAAALEAAEPSGAIPTTPGSNRSGSGSGAEGQGPVEEGGGEAGNVRPTPAPERSGAEGQDPVEEGEEGAGTVRRTPGPDTSGPGVEGQGPDEAGEEAGSSATLPDSGEAGIRTEQSRRLLEHWQKSPWWGHGSGASVPGYARSESAPWRFELTYHVVLLCFGVIGLVVLMSWTLWTAVPLVRFGWRGDRAVQAVAAGWIGALIASATNPYLFKLDGMWMVMIPFGLAVALRRPLGKRGEGIS